MAIKSNSLGLSPKACKLLFPLPSLRPPATRKGFAMWINPRFEVQVLKFVHDQLIDYRDKAGDAYRRMSSALSKIVDSSRFKDKIQDLARSLNIIVYGLHETMIRNSVGEEAKAKELMELEIDIAKMIEFGYITTEEQLRDYLYKVLRSKKALPL